MFITAVKFALVAFACFWTGLQAFAVNADVFPNGQAERCYTDILIPEITETVYDRVEVRPARTRQFVVPAVYEKQIIPVRIKDAETQYVGVPAQYEYVTEQVMVEPQRVVLVEAPAQYEIQSKTVINQAGHAEIVRTTREATAAHTLRRTLAAKYQTVTRKVVRTPAYVQEVTIPAEYLQIPVNVMIQRAHLQTETIPAVYKTAARQVTRAPRRLEAREVLCDTPSRSVKIAEVQRGLTKAGFPVTPDGIAGPITRHALAQFQLANGLSVGAMTLDTVRALGVEPYDAPVANPPLMTASADTRGESVAGLEHFGAMVTEVRAVTALAPGLCHVARIAAPRSHGAVRAAPAMPAPSTWQQVRAISLPAAGPASPLRCVQALP